ncbi:hemopexin [Rhea pennata]|uniref:hemopexin n=1 Tax=Rhea pennata TaxID=8795 RepID=UPI002E25563B
MHGPIAALCLAWALALGCARPLTHEKPGAVGVGPHHVAEPPSNDTGLSELCGDGDGDGGGLDAVTLSANGTMLLFRGGEVWERSRRGLQRRPLAAFWPELGGPVQAALCIHRRKDPQEHDSLYLFQGEQVWAYAGGQLRAGFPQRVGDVFPGIPGGLDAAVECHPEECRGESILFFKGDTVYSFDLELRVAKQRSWLALQPCTAALRWLERYYCLHGTSFQRFNPVTGEVPPGYPRDIRDYFIPCPGRGHGYTGPGNKSQEAAGDRCSERPFDAFASDDAGRIYAFRGGQYFRLDSQRDGWHAWPLGHAWPELQGEVDAAFAWDKKMYLIQGSQVSIYLSDQGYKRVEGYPRALHDELGITSVDAAFTCPDSEKLYVISGNSIRLVDLKETPRRAEVAVLLPHAHVDGALCTANGVFLFHGPNYHQYQSVAELTGASQPAPPRNISVDFFQCPQ